MSIANKILLTFAIITAVTTIVAKGIASSEGKESKAYGNATIVVGFSAVATIIALIICIWS